MRKVNVILLLTCVLCFNFYFHGNQFSNNEQDGKDARNIEPLLSDIFVDSYRVPGINVSVPLDRIVKIGLLSDLNVIWGDHAWKGLLLAAREINELGGILINGTQYYIGLVRENTKELTSRVTSEAENATNYMIQNHDPHFITGGISDEPFHTYLEIIMDHEIPFISTTSANDITLCQNVLDDYERYKYFFRITPGNWTSILIGVKDHILSLAKYLNATYGGTGKNKIAILHDTSQFGEFASSLFQNPLNPWFGLPNFNLTVVENIVYPENATLDDFEMYWNQIETAEAQITMILYMADPKIDLIVKQYQAVKPRCLLFNPMFGDLYGFQFWDNTEGACQFEILFQTIANTSKTSLTIPFFNSFINEYGTEPCHAGTGSYDTVYLLKHAVTECQSFNSDTIVATLEKINSSNYFIGAHGNLAFTSSHDLLYGYPYGYGLLTQFKYIDGTKIIIPSDEVYPNFLAMDSLRLPYWGVNGLLTDPPQPPGIFTMSSTAETPEDLDGKFNLTWTASEGAENYSIYMANNAFTYISKKFDLIAYQTASSPFQTGPLQKGDYYFRVVAYNETGETMSSNDVHVNIPGPGSFYLSSDKAGNPDTDGKFDLVWTASERADNYSVYRYKSEITTINESLTLLANQTAQSPFSITGLSNGKYYFAVAAYNELGYTLSDNNVYIIVKIPFDMTVILIVSIGSAVGITSIVLGKKYIYPKLKSKTEKRKDEHKLKK